MCLVFACLLSAYLFVGLSHVCMHVLNLCLVCLRIRFLVLYSVCWLVCLLACFLVCPWSVRAGLPVCEMVCWLVGLFLGCWCALFVCVHADVCSLSLTHSCIHAMQHSCMCSSALSGSSCNVFIIHTFILALLFAIAIKFSFVRYCLMEFSEAREQVLWWRLKKVLVHR